VKTPKKTIEKQEEQEQPAGKEDVGESIQHMEDREQEAEQADGGVETTDSRKDGQENADHDSVKMGGHDESEGSGVSPQKEKQQSRDDNVKQERRRKKSKSKSRIKGKEAKGDTAASPHVLELYVRGPPGPTLAFEFASEEYFVEQSARAIAQGCYDQPLPQPVSLATPRDGIAPELSQDAGGQGKKRGSVHKTRLKTLTQLSPRDLTGYIDHGSLQAVLAVRSFGC
jgi:hypothetical protein